MHLNKFNLIIKVIIFNFCWNTLITGFVNANTFKKQEHFQKTSIISSSNNQLREENKSLNSSDKLDTSYIDTKEELKDYIIDTDDTLSIDFLFANQFDGNYSVNPEGEIILPRLEDTYVRGLTTSELQKLLEEKYKEYLIDPQIKIRISGFKKIRVLIQGEVRTPGIYRFAPNNSNFSFDVNDNEIRNITEKNSLENSESMENQNESKRFSNNFDIKSSNSKIITISDAIRRANGITSLSDLSRIELIRDLPLGKGGGKKKAIIDFTDYLNGEIAKDIRLFDGDKINIPKLNDPFEDQIPKSILSGLSPKFISVQVYGRIENPGKIILPLESTLSDAIDVSGPIKPLSGEIILIRYLNNGKLVKLKIPYRGSAKRGSKRNPYVKEGDLISIKNSILGKSTGIVSEITQPFIGIYSTKELIEGLGE